MLLRPRRKMQNKWQIWRLYCILRHFFKKDYFLKKIRTFFHALSEMLPECLKFYAWGWHFKNKCQKVFLIFFQDEVFCHPTFCRNILLLREKKDFLGTNFGRKKKLLSASDVSMRRFINLFTWFKRFFLFHCFPFLGLAGRQYYGLFVAPYLYNTLPKVYLLRLWLIVYIQFKMSVSSWQSWLCICCLLYTSDAADE